MKIKKVLDDLVVEVTRKCNLACKHCLRGPAQNKDLNIEGFKKDFKKNIEKYIEGDYINSITFTGGEPFLNIDTMKEVFDYITKEKEINIGNFYIVTNGTKFSIKALNLLTYFYESCVDNGISMLKISNSPYHIEERGEKIEIDNWDDFILCDTERFQDIKEIDNNIEDEEKLDELYDERIEEIYEMIDDVETLRKIEVDNDNPDAYNYLLYQGNAATNKLAKKENKPRNRNDIEEAWEDGEKDIEKITLYYSADRTIIDGYCDYSYDTIKKQRQKNNKENNKRFI